MKTSFKLKLRGDSLISDNDLISFNAKYFSVVDDSSCPAFRILGSSGSCSLSLRASYLQRVPTDILRFSWKATRKMGAIGADPSLQHRGVDYLAHNFCVLLGIIVNGPPPNGFVSLGGRYAQRFVGSDEYEILFSGFHLELADHCDPSAFSGVYCRASATQYIMTRDCKLSELCTYSVKLFAGYEAYGSDPLDTAYTDLFQFGFGPAGYIVPNTFNGVLTQADSDAYFASRAGREVTFGS